MTAARKKRMDYSGGSHRDAYSDKQLEKHIDKCRASVTLGDAQVQFHILVFSFRLMVTMTRQQPSISRHLNVSTLPQPLFVSR